MTLFPIGTLVYVDSYNDYWNGALLRIESGWKTDPNTTYNGKILPAGGGISFGDGYDCSILSIIHPMRLGSWPALVRWHDSYLVKYKACGSCPGQDPKNHQGSDMCNHCWNFLKNPPQCNCDIFNYGCNCRRLEWESKYPC